jgi:hypothetical protein
VCGCALASSLEKKGKKKKKTEEKTLEMILLVVSLVMCVVAQKGQYSTALKSAHAKKGGAKVRPAKRLSSSYRPRAQKARSTNRGGWFATGRNGKNNQNGPSTGTNREGRVFGNGRNGNMNQNGPSTGTNREGRVFGNGRNGNMNQNGPSTGTNRDGRFLGTGRNGPRGSYAGGSVPNFSLNRPSGGSYAGGSVPNFSLNRPSGGSYASGYVPNFPSGGSYNLNRPSGESNNLNRPRGSYAGGSFQNPNGSPSLTSNSLFNQMLSTNDVRGIVPVVPFNEISPGTLGTYGDAALDGEGTVGTGSDY